jgi:hypothetical protein
MPGLVRARAGIRVDKLKTRKQAHDEIRLILSHTGMFTRRLERMEQVSTEMQELEWKIMRRTAASSRPVLKSNPAGD